MREPGAASLSGRSSTTPSASSSAPITSTSEVNLAITRG